MVQTNYLLKNMLSYFSKLWKKFDLLGKAGEYPADLVLNSNNL